LYELHDERFAVNEDAVKIENDGAQQGCWSLRRFRFGQCLSLL
jgi:hypothetical protein